MTGGLVLAGLTKRFGDVAAVDAIDLRITPGEFVSLLGPSGCGKTTTLRLIAGFLTPDAGEIRMGARLLSRPGNVVPPEQRNMSMIFQSYAVWPHMTVAQNVAYGLKMRKVPRENARRRVADALRMVRLDGMAERYPNELSGGQQQRVALARALVVEPQTLLLDEPLSNLDATLREEMRFEVRRLHDQFRITTVYVTHDQAEAMVTSDRIAVMNAGRVEQLGTPEEIYEAPRTAFVAGFIGASNIFECRVEENRATADGISLALAAAVPPGRRSLSIRPHGIEIAPGDRPAPGSVNTLRGTVRQQVYLGHSRDYQIAVDGSAIILRVIVAPHVRHDVGAAVVLHIPPAACHLLAEA
jgi:ABC-type Fe3+/spermidine/putrescine transport system ATPase subunit